MIDNEENINIEELTDIGEISTEENRRREDREETQDLPAKGRSQERNHKTDPGPDHKSDHKTDSDLATVLLLIPLIPILVLLLMILRLEQREVSVNPGETAAAEIVLESAEAETEAAEAETTLSSEELEDLAEREKLNLSVSSMNQFGVLLSDGSVNFRSAPDSSDSSNRIGQLNDLEVCERIEAEGDWYLVRHGDVTGYVHSDYCRDGTDARREARLLLGKADSDLLKDPVVIHTEGNEIRVFSEPRSNDMSLVTGRLPSGACFDVLGEEGDWYHILSGNVEGYISKTRCTLGEEALTIAQIKAENFCDVRAGFLNVRQEPFYGKENIIGWLTAGERVLAVETEVSPSDGAGWVCVSGFIHTKEGKKELSGYVNIGGNNASLYFGLDFARETDARELVLENYANPLICVTSGYVNIRESTNAGDYKNIIGKIYPGNGAELLGTVSSNESGDGNKWYHIRSGSVEGYVRAGTENESWFASGEKAKEAAPSYARLTAKITADCLNVRSTPSKESDDNVWTQVTRGQAYEVLEQKEDWVKIDLGSAEAENEAYISKNESFIQISYGLEEAIEFSYEEKANAFRQSVCDYACQFIGNPYVWGGNSLTRGCDCSGFVQQIMKKYGISMERASYYQAKQGVKRTSSTMRPGDLIFYAGSNGVVNHVGIYIGGGYMVGAQSRRSGIKVVKWNYRTPVAIRDVIGDRIE